jgi:hypothetical protein
MNDLADDDVDTALEFIVVDERKGKVGTLRLLDNVSLVLSITSLKN